MSKWLQRFSLWDTLSDFALKTHILSVTMLIVFCLMFVFFVVGGAVYTLTIQTGAPILFIMTIGTYLFKLLLFLAFIFVVILLMKLPLKIYEFVEFVSDKYKETMKHYNRIIERDKNNNEH